MEVQFQLSRLSNFLKFAQDVFHEVDSLNAEFNEKQFPLTCWKFWHWRGAYFVASHYRWCHPGVQFWAGDKKTVAKWYLSQSLQEKKIQQNCSRKWLYFVTVMGRFLRMWLQRLIVDTLNSDMYMKRLKTLKNRLYRLRPHKNPQNYCSSMTAHEKLDKGTVPGRSAWI